MSLEQPGKHKLSRRAVIGGALTAAAVAAAGGGYLAMRAREDGRRETSEMPDFRFLTDSARPQNLPAGRLQGKTLSDLYASFLGLKEEGQRVGDSISLDPRHQIGRLWQRKLRIAPHTSAPQEMLRAARLKAYKEQPEMFDLAEMLYRSYDPMAPKSDLRAYKTRINNAIEPVRESVEKLLREAGERVRLSRDQAALVLEAQRRLGGKEFIAYSLAELMPAADGMLNTDVLDFLLRNAGEDFIGRIPAIYDKLISFGPYQFTHFALDGTHGASAVDRLLPRPFLPPRVADLEGAQHHQAAYLFAVYNMVQLARRLDAQKLAAARHRIESVPIDVVVFTAVSHNKPTEGVRSFTALVDAEIAREKEARKLADQITVAERELRGKARALRAAAERQLKELRHKRELLINNPLKYPSFIRSSASLGYARKTMANFRALQ